MAVEALVSVEDYLHTAYRPDRDYIDGEIMERNLGEREHSAAQRRLLLSLCIRCPEIESRVLPEQRVQVKPNRFRVPDICVLSEVAPRESVVRTPPALCIEIISKDDSMSENVTRIADYFEMGTPTCWIVDPIHRRAWIAVPGSLTEVSEGGTLRAGVAEIPLAEVLE